MTSHYLSIATSKSTRVIMIFISLLLRISNNGEYLSTLLGLEPDKILFNSVAQSGLNHTTASGNYVQVICPVCIIVIARFDRI